MQIYFFSIEEDRPHLQSMKVVCEIVVDNLRKNKVNVDFLK